MESHRRNPRPEAKKLGLPTGPGLFAFLVLAPLGLLALLGFVLFGEEVSPARGVGSAAIVAGMWILVRHSAESDSSPDPSDASSETEHETRNRQMPVDPSRAGEAM